MPSAGHRKARRTSPAASGLVRTAAVPAIGATAIATAFIATLTFTDEPATAQPSRQSDTITASLDGARYQNPVSRNAERAPIPDPASAQEAKAGEMYVIADAELRSASKDDAPVLATLKPGTKVAVGAEERDGYRQVIHHDLVRWVSAEALSKEPPAPPEPPEPEPEEEKGISAAECASGSEVESGLQPKTVDVHRAVCAAFPEISEYGGVAPRGEHATGHSLDIMVSGPAGWEIAEFLREHHAELGIDYLIYEQKIWSIQRSGEGWRPMSSRGGATADHMDHVHVTTVGSGASGG